MVMSYDNTKIIIFNYPNGTIKEKRHYYNNLLHNDNGPAVISYNIDGTILEEVYYLNGKICNDILHYMIMVSLNNNSNNE